LEFIPAKFILWFSNLFVDLILNTSIKMLWNGLSTIG